ncbi:general substrate transporter, partial [Aureobasidium melanogenum]
MSTSTSRKPFFGLTGGWLTFWITVACAVDMTLFGYDQAVFSGVVVSNNFLELHDLVGPTKTKVLSTVAAMYNVGCFLGAVLAFTVGDRLGRKKAVLLGTAIMTVGAILQATSFSLPHMLVGRIIAGIGNGINTATAPIWQTETAQAKWRGKLVIIEMMMNIAGFTLCNWINYALSFRGGSLAWRFPLAFQLIFIVMLFITVPWLPESPRWLVNQDRHDEALEIMACLEAKELDDPVVVTLQREVIESVQYERLHAVRWRDLLRGKVTGETKTIRRLLLGAGTQLMQQLQGINIMSYYLPTVLIEFVGLSNEKARLITAINATTYLAISCISVPYVEKVGRRGLMLLSTAGQGLCFLIITILLKFGENNSTVATASIAFFFLYYISFGIGMLGIPWLYPAEINSLPMRTKGAALATSVNWLSNFVIVEITPIGIQNLGWQFWIIFTIFNAVCIPIIYCLYPETANRTLEDLDLYYRDDPSLIVTKDKDATSSQRPMKYIEQEREELAKAVANRTETIEYYGNEKAGPSV